MDNFLFNINYILHYVTPKPSQQDNLILSYRVETPTAKALFVLPNSKEDKQDNLHCLTKGNKRHLQDNQRLSCRMYQASCKTTLVCLTEV